MRFIALAALGIGMLTAPMAQGAEFKFRPENLAKELNKVAKKSDIPFRFSTGDCGQDVKETCRVFGKAVQGVVTSQVGKNSDGIIMVLDDKSGDTTDAMLAWGLVMMLVSPELTQDERGATLVSILSPVIQGGQETATSTVGDVTYTFTVGKEIGTIFSAEAQ